MSTEELAVLDQRYKELQKQLLENSDLSAHALWAIAQTTPSVPPHVHQLIARREVILKEIEGLYAPKKEAVNG